VGLVYDPRELLGVTTAKPRVAGVLQLIIPNPPFLFGLVHFLQATRGLLFALHAVFLHIQCLLGLSTSSKNATGTSTGHM
jgi:hypothetical protein